MKIARVLLLVVPVLALGAAGDSTTAKRGWLGVYTDDLAKPMLVALDIDHGVLVTDVVDESPAAKAGIEAGDVILSLDEKSIADGSALRWAVRDKPEQKVGIKFRRRGKDKKLDVTLGTRELAEQAFDFEWPAMPSEALREAKRALREAGPALKLKLEHSDLTLDSLRKQMVELRNELNDLRKKLTEKQTNR
jgi:membrane-associated protease RseP (regulator of RpoE activity)